MLTVKVTYILSSSGPVTSIYKMSQEELNSFITQQSQWNESCYVPTIIQVTEG